MYSKPVFRPPRSMRLLLLTSTVLLMSPVIRPEPSADFFHISLKIINFVIINRAID